MTLALNPRSSAMSALLSTLQAGLSTSIVIMGDVTNISAAGWAAELAQQIGRDFPDYRIILQFFLDGTNLYTSEEAVRQGKFNERYLNMTGSRTRMQPGSIIGAITGDNDITVRAQHDTWRPGTLSTLHSHWGASGNRGRRLSLRSDGKLQFFFTTDGINELSAVSDTAITVPTTPTRTPLTIRATRAASSGAVSFFVGTDNNVAGAIGRITNIQSTQLGATITGATGASFASTADYQIGGRNDTLELFTGKIYSVSDRRAIDGVVANAPGIENWHAVEAQQAGDLNTIEGSPTLQIRVAAVDGATFASHLNVAAKRDAMLSGAIAPGIVVLSADQNEGTSYGIAFEQRWNDWLAGVRSSAPLLAPVVVSQQPFVYPATGNPRVDQRRKHAMQLLSWAARNNVPAVDTFREFTLAQRLGEHIGSNGRSVTPAGAKFWSDVFWRAMQR